MARWMILVLCFLAMSVTAVLSLCKPREYQAAVTIVPPLDILQRESVAGLGAKADPLLRQVISTATGGVAQMYVEILQSREVADTLIDRFHLVDVYEQVRYRSDARKQLKANTKVETTDGGAVRISVRDLDPNRAAGIANAYIEELDRQNKRLSAGQATSKRLFLETRLQEVEARLSKIDNILSREAKTQEMLYELLVQQYEMAKIEEAKSMPTIQVLDPPVVPELGVARGTVKKGLLAGVAAFMLGVLLAFVREYIAQVRRREGQAETARVRVTGTGARGMKAGTAAESAAATIG
jgi:uncharacterized protein involved in exopolysaccharide biosynthesis